jgi:hypothetical protein
LVGQTAVWSVVTAYPAQLVETFDPSAQVSRVAVCSFTGDNKDVLAWLLANGYRGKWI